jgi:hypothetical protein
VANFLGLLLGWFSTLKVEVICSSETSVNVRTAWRYIPEYGNIRNTVVGTWNPTRAAACNLTKSSTPIRYLASIPWSRRCNPFYAAAACREARIFWRDASINSISNFVWRMFCVCLCSSLLLLPYVSCKQSLWLKDINLISRLWRIHFLPFAQNLNKVSFGILDCKAAPAMRNCIICTIRIIKSRRMRWAGHVARMGEKRNVCSLLIGKPEGKRPLRRPRREI